MSTDPGKSGSPDRTSTPDDEAAIERAGGRRRLVEIRCGFAESARREADAAAHRVVEAKRLYDDEVAALARAQAAIDLAATHSAKDAAHRDFRAAVAAARSRRQVEAAANGWLSEINRINGQGRVALAHIRREREAAEALFSELTRLSDIAEASAAMASSATQACIAARAALDGADEIEAEDTVEPPAEAPAEGTAAEATAAGASAAGDSADAARPVEALPVAAPVAEPLSPPAAASPPVEAEPQVPATEASAPAADADSSPTAPSSPSTPAALTAGDISRATDWMVVDIRAPDPQTITRLMRREGRTLSILVDRLAGNEPSARSYWQLLLSNFVDSVVASAIGEGYLEFPKGSPFWDQFSRSEVREVARGLTALGFSFDGFGAFADGRVPTRRDLALAVGAAGLLPVRIRHWPNPDEAALLFQGVRASADAFIAVKAPALTLGELVRALGRRAEPLANLWNEWARVRPLLFATDL